MVAAPKHKAKAESVVKKLGIDPEELIYLGEDMWCVNVSISPKRAEEWLPFNTNNRTFKERSIQTMTEDMVANAFPFTHEGIAFGYDCELKDGQNRLSAIKRSGKTIKCLIFIGLSDTAKGVINQGVNRTPLDAAKFAGRDANKLAISSSKMCEVGLLGNTKGISNSKAVDLIDKHAEAFKFVKEHLIGEKPVKGIAVAAICSAVMRAYTEYKDHPKKLSRLKKFCQILQDGQYDHVQPDVAAFRLRETAIKNNYGGSSASKELYRLAESAIVNFIQSTIIRKLQPVADEQFPTTEEMDRIEAENEAQVKAEEEKTKAKEQAATEAAEAKAKKKADKAAEKTEKTEKTAEPTAA